VHFSNIAIVSICAISILCMLVRPWGIKEAYWACGGALVLVASRLLTLRETGQAVRKGLDVYLFLTGMMVLAEMAREEGVFDWIADVAGRHARGSSKRLFLLIYLTGTVVTALLSNDATAVVLTPAVLAVVRKARIDPKPHLLACAFIANAASFILPISNPANLVIFAKQMPPLLRWLGIFTLPSIAAVVITFAVLRWRLRAELEDRIQDLDSPAALAIEGKLALAGLALAGVALIAASTFGWI
jgi:arsenical pump membrane protein